VTLEREGIGVVGGAEGAGAGSTRTRGPVGGSGRDLGGGGAAAGSGAGYDGSGWAAGDSFLGAGVNTDSNGTTTVGSSGDSGASGTPAAWPTGAVDGGGPGGEAGGFGRLQAEKGGSGLDTGGNSDSGGRDDAMPDGARSA
jgi:hypothetical protein